MTKGKGSEGQLASQSTGRVGWRRYRVTITGVVQGVGFRPFVYNLAIACGIAGTVLNSSQGVIIEAEGPEEALQAFLKEIRERPPRLARVEKMVYEEMAPVGERGFSIRASQKEKEVKALVPPDVALCPDCRREIADPQDRHFRYPFTNCTNCGPRFTIINELPYDRSKTSMAAFPMCPECAAEYRHPMDRRFHAQPVACPACGPQVELVDAKGQRMGGSSSSDGVQWLEAVWSLLAQGKIVAVKSLGGFHLACDAFNQEAVERLRRNKGREAKPFAVMVRDLETARELCQVSELEAALLTSPAAPIVVLVQRPETQSVLPKALAPGLRTLGVMLPYTPLHCLLLSGPFRLLVMTSGNKSELPLAKDNQSALQELAGLADYFLWHNRDIVNRCDDSLVQLAGPHPIFLRRSRGYVPEPITVPGEGSGPDVLGIGAEMKNTFCLLKGNNAFLSQHIGELELVEGEENLRASLASFIRLIEAEPRVVVYDLHPHYRSSQIAQNLPAQEYIGVQHHHAHMAACLAENGYPGPAIGAILDGTGYGLDGNMWGFEILSGDLRHFRRHWHLQYVPLPGGERAVRRPWVMAIAFLSTVGSAARVSRWSRLLGRSQEEVDAVRRLIASGFNCPLASSAGRLFDAVSALLDICQENTYEGQAAMELGELVREQARPALGTAPAPYPFELAEGVIKLQAMFDALLIDLERGLDPEYIALRFHETVVAMVVAAVQPVRERTGLGAVVLSGGTWQNPYLLIRTREELTRRGFEVFSHRLVPPGDGGISLGQAVIGRWLSDIKHQPTCAGLGE